MYNINIMIYIFICMILYIQSIYSRNITINSIDIPKELIYTYDEKTAISKSAISAKPGWNYYCRKDDCVTISNDYDGIKPYIQLPDENGNVKNYIVRSFPYDEKLKKLSYYADFIDYSNLDYGVEILSLKCNNDSECLYNKCIDNHCVFNDEAQVVHCDTIYNFFALFEYSYIHCGKGYHDPCNKNNECSSKKCMEGSCSSLLLTPSDSVATGQALETLICIAVIGGIFIIVAIIYSVINYRKNNFEKIENKQSNIK